MFDLGDIQKNFREQTNNFSFPTQPQSPVEDVLLALDKYNVALAELRQASQLPYSRYPLNYRAENPSSILLPHLNFCRSSAQILSLRAIAELRNGNADKAMEDVLLSLRVEEATRSEPFLISQLVRVTQFRMILQVIYEGLSQHRWSESQLAALSVELDKRDYLSDYQLAMRSELASTIGSIEFLRKHRNVALFGVENNPKLLTFLLTVLIPDGFCYQNEITLSRYYERWAFPAIDPQKKLVFPSYGNLDDFQKATKGFSPYNVLARLAFPAVQKSIYRSAKIENSKNLARVAIALERYRLAHGEHPETLSALTPQFIDNIPNDIMNGQPLLYRREDNGLFTLYSVGWNQTDDGGNFVPQKYYPYEEEKSDWVWKYPVIVSMRKM